MLDKKSIEKYLAYPADVEVVSEVTSTNSMLKVRAQEGAACGTLLAATKQSNGRGRLERKFFSPENSGVYFSFLVRDIEQSKANLLTVIAALATHRAINKYSSRQSAIKWVNDIYADGKKCAGILVEGSRNMDNSSLNYAVVGVGINLKEPSHGYPIDLKNIATTALDVNDIFDDVENAIIAETYNNFWAIYLDESKEDIVSQYRDSLFMLGSRVVASYADHEIEATAIDIDGEGRLILLLDDGSTTILSLGEVRLKV